MDAKTVFPRTSTQPTGMVRDIWSAIGRLTASLNFFFLDEWQIFHHCSLFPPDGALRLTASPSSNGGFFVVVSCTQHKHVAVPVFLGSLFRLGIAYFARFQSTLWFHSKCFGVLRLPARILEQQSFSKTVISCRGSMLFPSLSRWTVSPSTKLI